VISSEARILAAKRIALIEERLRPAPPITDQYGSAQSTPDIGRRVAARIQEVEHANREPPESLTPAEARAAADRLAGLEWRAVQAEVAFRRMRARRLYRVADVVAGWLRRPWRGLGVFGGLRAALQPRTLPVLPDPPSPESYLKELAAGMSPGKPRPLPYPHLRVAHAGRMAMFGKVAPHFPLSTVDLDQELMIGFDMLLIEPGVDDPLDEVDSETVSRFQEADIPVLYVARTTDHLTSPVLSQVDVVLTEDPELAGQATGQGHSVLTILPSVDDTIHNPIGWKHQPDPTLIVIADHPGITTHLDTLAPHPGQIHLYGAAIPGLDTAQHTPDRPIGADQASAAKNHLAAYTTPQLSATPSSHHQLVLELVAAGTPVITAPDPTLNTLLDDHYLPAATSEELQTHLETLQHPPSRERHSVPARRHVHTNHTRRHRFEQVLTHLGIPLNPPPRISILLATKRPENIEHALGNVTNQNWANKELHLILHGEDFDLDHIQNLTSQLPYPTQIHPCPQTWTLGDCLNTGLDQATGTYITKMDDDDHYGPNHLTDLITAHTYSNADITGKWGNIVYLANHQITIDYLVRKEESFGNHLPGATMFLERVLLEEYRFLRVNRHVDSSLWLRMRGDGWRLFSTHRFGFIRVRHSDHTFQHGDEQFMAGSSGNLRSGLDLSGSMI